MNKVLMITVEERHQIFDDLGYDITDDPNVYWDSEQEKHLNCTSLELVHVIKDLMDYQADRSFVAGENRARFVIRKNWDAFLKSLDQ